ncbi:MAG: TRAP transporter small permease [Alphaproteobacteria bacterium]|nr:TRAP transporter small permease [Alphaproteobacteria bacterium]MCB9930363.1 TRAP transporter small permease [Alphaproteobacteria bacterium]
MAQSFERFYQVYGRLVLALGMVAGAAVFAIMWLIDANVLMRKLFNQPVTGTLEITEGALVLIIFLGLAYTQRRRGHIRVTLLTRHFPQWLRNLLYVLVLLIGAGLCAWYTWAAYTYAIRSYTINEMEWGVLIFQVWPIKAAIAVGWGLLSVQFLLDAIRAVFVARGQLEPVFGEEV